MNLDEMKRLEEAATKGPWVRGSITGCCRKVHGPEEKGPNHGNGFCKYDKEFFATDDFHSLASLTSMKRVSGNFDYDSGGVIEESDSVFIAACRSWVPWALARIEEAKQMIDFTDVGERDDGRAWLAAVEKGSP